MNTGRFFKFLDTVLLFAATTLLAGLSNYIPFLGKFGFSLLLLPVPLLITSILCWAIGVALCLLAEQINLLQKILENKTEVKPFTTKKSK